MFNRCSKRRPFSEAGKVKSSTLLSQIFVSIVTLFTRSACIVFEAICNVQIASMSAVSCGFPPIRLVGIPRN